MSPQRESVDLVAGPVSRGSLRDQVTSRIMAAIFLGRFHSGQRLVVQDLANSYQASPTPVREALVQLASHGLVDLLPNRGAVVQPFGAQEIREISQIRRLLEAEATHLACGRIPVDDLLAVEQELRRLEVLAHDQVWDDRARAIDTKLHGIIASCCGSNRLAVEIGRYLVLFRTMRDLAHERDAWTSFSRTNDVPEHMAIVVALLKSDAEGAAQAMNWHIRSAAAKLEEMMFPAQYIPELAAADANAAEPPTINPNGPTDRRP
jgi:DNA-binding GntR family transcriptional regulator